VDPLAPPAVRPRDRDAIVVIGLVAVWVAGHVAEFRDRVAQAFRVLSPPTRYLRTRRAWQAADWSLRLLTIWFMLAAFGIPQTLREHRPRAGVDERRRRSSRSRLPASAPSRRSSSTCSRASRPRRSCSRSASARS
jgi:hypothetical protein